MPPGYCRAKGVSLHLQDQNGSRGLHQIQAPSLGLPAEAGGLEEEGDQKGTGNGGVMKDHFVQQSLNLGKHRGLLKIVVGVFSVWVFS